MISFPRLYLISLLMLLQFAAPLIHAHTSLVTHVGGLVHLPEFEQVNVLPKHAPEFLAQSNQNDEMVAMSSGIKDDTLQLQLLQISNAVFLFYLFFVTKEKRQSHCFLWQTEPIPDFHFLNLASPRAPPFFTFR